MYEISKTNFFNLNLSGKEVEIFNKVKAKVRKFINIVLTNKATTQEQRV